MRDRIEYRSLQRQGKCVLCDKDILKDGENATILSFYKNGRCNSISICDDCLNKIVEIRRRERNQ